MSAQPSSCLLRHNLSLFRWRGRARRVYIAAFTGGETHLFLEEKKRASFRNFMYQYELVLVGARSFFPHTDCKLRSAPDYGANTIWLQLYRMSMFGHQLFARDAFIV